MSKPVIAKLGIWSSLDNYSYKECIDLAQQAELMGYGAHPYFVTPEHTARARAILGPDKFLAPEQKVLLVKDASQAQEISGKAMSIYLSLPNYRNNLLTLGFNEADFENGGSDRLVDAIVAWGDENTVMRRIEEHWDNGADHVCIQALRTDGEIGFDPMAVKALAPNS